MPDNNGRWVSAHVVLVTRSTPRDPYKWRLYESLHWLGYAFDVLKLLELAQKGRTIIREKANLGDGRGDQKLAVVYWSDKNQRFDTLAAATSYLMGK